MIDYEKIAERYKISPAEVKQKVEAYANKVRGVLKDTYAGDELDAEVEKVVVGQIGDLFQLRGLERAKDRYFRGEVKKANVIVLGVSPSEDGNSYEKWKARELFKKDQAGAVNSGIVRMGTSKDGKPYPIPLYSKPTKTVKNADGTTTEVADPNFGKDIPEALKVHIPMIIAGWVKPETDKSGNVTEIGESVEPLFVMGSMYWDKDMKHHPEVGKKSTVYGNLNQGKYFSVERDAYEGADVYQGAYDTALRVLPNTELWMDLTTLNDTPIYEFDDTGKRKSVYTKFAIQATIQRSTVKEMKSQYSGNTYHQARITIGDSDVINGISMKTTYEPVVNYIDSQIEENDEVIVVGCKKSFAEKDKQGEFILDSEGNRKMLPYYELWGIIKKFDAKHADVMKRLADAGLI